MSLAGYAEASRGVASWPHEQGVRLLPHGRVPGIKVVYLRGLPRASSLLGGDQRKSNRQRLCSSCMKGYVKSREVGYVEGYAHGGLLIPVNACFFLLCT